jgi:hypothetical protein
VECCVENDILREISYERVRKNIYAFIFTELESVIALFSSLIKSSPFWATEELLGSLLAPFKKIF